ncbi:MAG: hypothetical protein CMP14_05345 [Rickettsiales bacterium]|jgi:uncharacterized protein (UPF0335 family)|nr:hypothetical protein [Rhodospirillaceae bacterium]MBO88925.1 hypothetical protein [Rickettsiales bacterium]|tara:strand:- start:3252 stop:3527 length:276 start_codon:yes stop_codon:yes gene_type:complete
MSEVGGVAGDRLRSFIERIERLEEERVTIAVDIREVYAEAKASGFDPKIMRQVVKLRKMESADRQEQEAILEVYKEALGMEVPASPQPVDV